MIDHKIQKISLKQRTMLFVAVFFVLFSGVSLYSFALADPIDDMRTACLKKNGVWSAKDSSCSVNVTPQEREEAKISQSEFMCGYPEDPVKFISYWAKKCWFCDSFEKVIEVIQSIATEVYGKVEGGMLKLLAICFSLWIAVKVISFIAMTHAKDAPEFYTEIGLGALRALGASLAISMGSDIWNYIVGPLASGTFDYSRVALQESLNTVLPDISSLQGSNPIDVISDKIVGGIFNLINEHLMKLISSGWVLMTLIMNEGVLCIPYENIYLFISGLIILILGVIFLFSIPFILVDVCFRLGIFFILLPVFIFCWAFSSTRSFFRQGMSLLIHSMMLLLVISIIIALCTKLITSEMQIVVFSTDVEDNIKLAQRHYGTDLGNLVTTMAILLFSFLIVKKIPDITDMISPDNAGQHSSGGRELFKAGANSSLKLAGASVGFSAASAQWVGRKASVGTQADAEVRAAQHQSQVATYINKWQEQQNQPNLSNNHNRYTKPEEVVKMPQDIAEKLNKGYDKATGASNYQLTPDEITRVLAENRYRRSGIKGKLVDFTSHMAESASEKFYSVVTGQKAQDYYKVEMKNDDKKESDNKTENTENKEK